MKQFILKYWPAFAIAVAVGSMATAGVVGGIKADAAVKHQKIIIAELKVQAVKSGLGEFYVSTNTATIEFRLKEKP